ncbi:conserved hypothetical protein [Leishmania major strain Friedlin]|uniref:Uncharacterized protein n=1 Tax=Leishmania major TaxID=5664 RepID=Q4Q8D3_LEIMA|nr:conserved hypothetical protein [Leishmania major strain Friedlin]CAG9577241.1 hypothetical_protein_-_conserved [Leishmania major strain Friedlin]CAJ05393.1 conserved hypothetical protein [Leishmania major strain Friedlin]|eukprot:XP_001684415.1 conserved hypothetical protein [Leishmania major strain Friedlin]
MAEHQQSFFAQAVSPLTPEASLKSRAASIKSASPRHAAADEACASAPPQRRASAAGSGAVSPAPAPPPRIHDKAWLFHTVLLPFVRTTDFRRDGSAQHHRAGDVQEEAAALLARDNVTHVRPPKSTGHASTSAPVDPAPTFLMEPNHLFFEDTPSPSRGGSLADRYSLRTLYTSRCVSLGMRRPFDRLLQQLPSEAGQGAADQLRMLVARDTYIPAKACQALTVLLPYCTGLEYINLCNAGLRSKSGCMTGVNALLDALICGPAVSGIGAALHTIDLSLNKLDDRTGRRLVRLVQRQPHLRVVNVDGTEIRDRMKARIAEALLRNLKECTPPILLDEANEKQSAAATAA